MTRAYTKRKTTAVKKSFVIEKNVPKPTSQSRWSDIITAIDELKPNENVFLPNGYNDRDSAKLLNLVRAAAHRKVNGGVIAKAYKEGVRIWRKA